MDEITNLARDIYDLHIYGSEITETQAISQEEYGSYENKEGKLTPELIESLIEKPENLEEKRFYVEDIRNCIIFNYEYKSFKQERTCYAIVTGEIVFQIEYRVQEKVTVDVPFDYEFTINAGKVKILRPAVKNTPTESGEKLPMGQMLGFVVGIFQIVAFAALILTIIFAFRNYWQIGLIAAAIMGAVWLLGFLGRFFLKFLRTLVTWVVFMLLLGYFIVHISDDAWDTDMETEEEETEIAEDFEKEREEQLPIDTSAIDSMKVDAVFNTLSWSDYSHQNYSFNYRIDSSQFNQSRHNRATYLSHSWKQIYQNLYQKDNPLLKDIYHKYDSLGSGENSIDFARMVVSSIQEVPYTWILPTSCENAAIKQEISRSGYACLGNVRHFGIQSPIEFMANQKGDCDTKTVVLYAILKHFNFDVCILTSMAYEHAVLGINIPASGKHKMHQGKKYYAWETTVKGLDIGQLHPMHSDMALWEVEM